MTRRGVARLLAGGFGAGQFPVSPGSAGSLLALVLGAGLMALPAWVLPLAILAVTAAGLWAVRAAGAEDDPGWVVIDEVAGQWIALLGLLRPTWIGLACAFLIFRVVDITKPGPVGWADRRHSPAGVMADDLIAGAISAFILWAIRSRFPAAFG
jgi:phosphatidylglycerophosphatase A